MNTTSRPAMGCFGDVSRLIPLPRSNTTVSSGMGTVGAGVAVGTGVGVGVAVGTGVGVGVAVGTGVAVGVTVGT